MSIGIDTASDTSNEASCLKGATVSGESIYFVGRYLGGMNAMSYQEAIDLSTAGLYIVSLWETGGYEASYFDVSVAYANGQSDGLQAFTAAANTFRQPSGTPVYFAVDVDLTSEYQQGIQDYFNGVEAGYQAYIQRQHGNGLPVSTYYIGVYGGWNTLQWCYGNEGASYYWQAYAPGWSGGQNGNQWTHDNIRQQPKQSVCGLSVDVDEGISDPGGWKI